MHKDSNVVLVHIIALLGRIALVQATHFSIAWSVCLSSVTFVHTAENVWRISMPFGKGRFGVNPQPKHAIANPTLPPGEYKRVAIASVAKLLWFLLYLLFNINFIFNHELVLSCTGRYGCTHALLFIRQGYG